MDERHMRLVAWAKDKYPRAKRVWIASEASACLLLFCVGRGLYAGRVFNDCEPHVTPVLGHNAVEKIDYWNMDIEFRGYCCE
jgi:hypothetical protein